MNDFFAAAIARLIPLGLKRMGIDMPLQPAPQAAHMAVDDKRRMLGAIAATHGEQTLASLGAGVGDATDEPLLSALSPARGPHDLVARWQRLERYVHSSHRVRVERVGQNGTTLRHLSIDRGPAPHRHEDLLILGLLIGLLELTGTQGLRARVHGEGGWRYRDRRWQSDGWPADVSRWEFQWAGRAARETGPAQEAAHVSMHEIDLGDCVGCARHLMSQDPAHSWTIKALAGDMNMATRSLQRKLAAQQSSFTALLAQVKAASAARLLTTTDQPAAQIGYACGYSDQAHFGREFKRHTALTPLQYRTEFAAGST